MNLTYSRTTLLAAVLSAAALAGCDSITTEDATPAIARPAGTVVINGSVSGLSATRPVELTIETTNNGLNSGSKTVGFRGTEILRFGAVQVGANYNITITRTPAGRTCTIENGSGTATADVDNVTVTCVRDNTPLFTVTANIAAGISDDPPEGFAVTLTTEEGTETIEPDSGQASVTFALPIFYPPGNAPPPFRYTVTATNTEGGTTNTCVVTAATGELAQPGTGNITTPTVTSCSNTISAVAQYSAPSGGVPSVMGNGGLQLGLKNQLTGDIVVQAPLINAYGETVAFPGTFTSHSGALYEVVVQSHPAGQFCIVLGGGMAQFVTAQTNVTAQVRCRDVPATANQLKGVYHLQPRLNNDAGQPNTILAPTRNFLTFFPDGTFLYGTHHNTATAGVEHGFYAYNPGASTLNFTIWTDTNGSVGSSNGVSVPAVAACGYTASQFFPAGPPCAANLVTGPMTPFVGCGGICNFSAPAWVERAVAASPTGGLSGIATGTPIRSDFSAATFNYPAVTLPVTATAVVKTAGSPGVPGTLSLTFGAFALTNPNPVWELVEPVNAPNEIAGTWVSADSKRVFVYDKTTFYGFHAGVNGAPNLQDRCLIIEDPTSASSFYVNRPGPNFFGTPTCMVATADPADDARDGRVGTGAVDVPVAQTTPTNTTGPYIPGFAGRLPGTIATNVLNRSPTNYTVTPGSPDTLVIQDTLNDVPRGEPVTFMRTTTY